MAGSNGPLFTLTEGFYDGNRRGPLWQHGEYLFYGYLEGILYWEIYHRKTIGFLSLTGTFCLCNKGTLKENRIDCVLETQYCVVYVGFLRVAQIT